MGSVASEAGVCAVNEMEGRGDLDRAGVDVWKVD